MTKFGKYLLVSYLLLMLFFICGIRTINAGEEKSIVFENIGHHNSHSVEIIETADYDLFVFSNVIIKTTKEWTDRKQIVSEENPIVTARVYNDTLNYCTMIKGSVVWKQFLILSQESGWNRAVNANFESYKVDFISNNTMCVLTRDSIVTIASVPEFTESTYRHNHLDHLLVTSINKAGPILYSIYINRGGLFAINHFDGKNILSEVYGNELLRFGVTPFNSLSFLSSEGEVFVLFCRNCSGIEKRPKIDRENVFYKMKPFVSKELYVALLPKDNTDLFDISHDYLYFIESERSKTGMIKIKALPQKFMNLRWEKCQQN